MRQFSKKMFHFFSRVKTSLRISMVFQRQFRAQTETFFIERKMRHFSRWNQKSFLFSLLHDLWIKKIDLGQIFLQIQQNLSQFSHKIHLETGTKIQDKKNFWACIVYDLKSRSMHNYTTHTLYSNLILYHFQCKYQI